MLGRTLTAVHELPIPPDMDARDPRAFVAETWARLAGVAVPAFVADAVARLLAEEPPPPPYLVLSHNDVNPTNLVYDGSALRLLDWDMAGANDPYYDLAAAAVFFRMDDAACRVLFEAYDALDPDGPRFGYCRRQVAILCGTTFLTLAYVGGHVGDAGATLASTAGLADFYQRLQTGAVDIRSGEGQQAFGLALIKSAVD
jgi:aminoglycoside phosphotransferase (APT) family kinase protein